MTTSAAASAAFASEHELSVQQLSKAAFEPYGDVIEASPAANRLLINEGSAERYDDLARLDVYAHDGRAVVSIFRAQARELPLHLRSIERHQFGSQAFMPLMGGRFLVIVASAGPAPRFQDLRCFVAQAGQGINFARGTWHHPLIALTNADFLVIDRTSADGSADCEELEIGNWNAWVRAPNP